MINNGPTGLKKILNEAVTATKRTAARLRKNLSVLLASSVLLLFFLYIPFIHGPLNAEVTHPDTDTLVENFNPYSEGSAHASTLYVAATETAAATEANINREEVSDSLAGFFKADIAVRAQDFENSPSLYELNTETRQPTGDSAWSRQQVQLSSPQDVTRGAAESSMVSITFDGGYSASEANIILDELKRRGLTTTIFLSGTFIQRHPEITVRIFEEGHEVGNHTATHPHLTDYASSYTHKTLDSIDKKRLEEELREAERLFTSVTGGTMAPLWRAPYGEVNKELRAWAFEFGYLHIGWTYEPSTRESLDTLDWVSDTSSRFYLTKEKITERITGFGEKSGGAGGGIILMHLGTQREEDRASSVLSEMLDGLIDRGYSFVKVSTMLSNNRALKTASRRKSIRSYKKLSQIR